MEELLEFIERDDVYKTVSSWNDSPATLPFELTPQNFMSYAEKDLNEDDVRSRVNALGNIKRAIDCRLDSLIYLFGFYPKAKKENWSFISKTKILNNHKVIAPRILSKINKMRNKLEHDFKIPSHEEVEDALDIAHLFILYTDIFTQKTFSTLDFEVNNSNDNGFPWLSLNLYMDEGMFLLKLIKGKEDSVTSEISVNDKEFYSRVLAQYIQSIKNR